MAEIIKQSDTNYIINKIGDTEAVIIIGGENPDKFEPSAHISWKCFTGAEKFFLNISPRSVIIDKEVETFVDGVRIKTGDRTDHIDTTEDERLKWFVHLDSKPKSGVFEWELRHNDGVIFNHQILTQQDIDDGARYKSDSSKNSYAIRCNKRNRYVDSEGNVLADYGTGKIGHIYRRKFISGDGRWWWIDTLEITPVTPTMSMMKVTVPQEILDSATYPAILNDTFGWDQIGTLDRTTAGNYLYCSGEDQPASNGTITSIDYHSPYNDSDAKTLAVYTDDGTNPDDLVDYSVSDTTQVDNDWLQLTAQVGYSVVSSATYWIGLHASGGVPYSYDNGASNTQKDMSQAYGSGLPAQFTLSNNSSRDMSLRATYTVAGGGGRPLPQAVLSGPFSGPLNGVF